MREPQYVALNERSACGWSPWGKLTSVRRSGIVSGGNYNFCEEDEWCVLQSGVYVACWSGRLSGHSGPEGGWRGESFEEHLAADASTFPLSPDLLQPSGLRPLLHGSHAFFILYLQGPKRRQSKEKEMVVRDKKVAPKAMKTNICIDIIHV